MANILNRKLLFQTSTCYIAALLTWQLLFWKNPLLKNVLVDIHSIFSCTILCYFILRMAFKPSIMDFIKVFIRTLFRVWLLIFITFAIARSMDRIGTLLSLTFIFGYIEGLLDINKWLEATNPFPGLFQLHPNGNKVNHALATILLMSIIHILCSLVIFVFYLVF